MFLRNDMGRVTKQMFQVVPSRNLQMCKIVFSHLFLIKFDGLVSISKTLTAISTGSQLLISAALLFHIWFYVPPSHRTVSASGISYELAFNLLPYGLIAQW